MSNKNTIGSLDMQKIYDKAKNSKDNVVVLDEPDSAIDFNKIQKLDTERIKKEAIKLKTEIGNNKNITRQELVIKYDWLYNNQPLIFTKAADNENLTLLFEMLDKIEILKKDNSKYDQVFEKVKTNVWEMTPNKPKPDKK